jgi:hypothetical protein
MLFHIIDNKKECNSIFVNDHIDKQPDYSMLSKTWSFDSSLLDHNIDFASLYVGGKNIDQCCPEHLKEEWDDIKKKHFSYLRSFQKAKVISSDYCFYDLVPESFVLDYNKVKSKITDYVFKNFRKPENYDFLVGLSDLVNDISKRPLNVDANKMNDKLHQYKARKFREKLSRTSPFVNYNVFGTVTGRLTTKKDSFPILTMDKAYRDILSPNNDFFLELDFNAAELRCLLALNGQPQPDGDIHEWHREKINNIYSENLTREEIKVKMFSWLYGGESATLGMPEIENFYNKVGTVEKYWDGQYVNNPFGRKIECDRFRALNFIIQSTTSDIFLRKAIKIKNALKGKKSYIMGLIHDSMVIDFSGEDREILKSLIDEFSNTEFGKFKVNVKAGKSYGSLKELSL